MLFKINQRKRQLNEKKKNIGSNENVQLGNLHKTLIQKTLLGSIALSSAFTTDVINMLLDFTNIFKDSNILETPIMFLVGKIKECSQHVTETFEEE